MPKRDWFVIFFLVVSIPTLFIIGSVFELEFVCMGIFFVTFFGIVVHRIMEERKMPNTGESDDGTIFYEKMYGSNPLDPFNYVKTNHHDPFE